MLSAARRAVVFAGILVLAATVIADDLSFCKEKCTKTYEEGSERDGCLGGCTHRGAIAASGPRGFVDCHLACDATHASASNETEPVVDGKEEKVMGASGESATEKSKSKEEQACHYACSLPLTNMVFMKVDYGTGDGAPRVQVIRKEGGEVSDNMDDTLRQLLLRPEDINGNLMAGLPRHLSMDDSSKMMSSSSSDEDSVSQGFAGLRRVPSTDGNLLSRLFRIPTGDDEFDKMQESLHSMMRSFLERAQLAARIAETRPQGHDNLALLGPEVHNEDGAGHQLILVQPVDEKGNLKEDFEELPWVGEDGGRHSAFFDRETLRRRFPFPALFQWTVCLVLLIAILCTVVVALLILRHMRAHRYRQLSSQGAAGAAGTLPAASLAEAGQPGPIPHKKIPVDIDTSSMGSLPEPTGVPPPAYDQLSVHSKR